MARRLLHGGPTDATCKTILIGERANRDWAGVWISVCNNFSDGDEGLRRVIGISAAPINSNTGDAKLGFSSENPCDRT